MRTVLCPLQVTVCHSHQQDTVSITDTVKSGLQPVAFTSTWLSKQASEDYFWLITSVCSFCIVNNDSIWKGFIGLTFVQSHHAVQSYSSWRYLFNIRYGLVKTTLEQVYGKCGLAKTAVRQHIYINKTSRVVHGSKEVWKLSQCQQHRWWF